MTQPKKTPRHPPPSARRPPPSSSWSARWTLADVRSVPLEYLQGLTHDAAAQRFFAGVRFAGKERRLQQAVEDAQACIDLKKRERGNLATWLRARPRHAALLPQSARN